MSRAKMISINYDRFISEIEKTNISRKVIAHGIGYASVKFFGNAKERGTITERAANNLDLLYGIKRKAYEITKPEPKVETKAEQKQEPSVGVDYVKLHNTIYRAVLTALRDNAQGLHDHLFEVR